MDTQIKLFEEKQVRSVWNADEEEWYFSVVDVVEILTESKDPKQYIKKMRSRDEQLNLNWVQFVPHFKWSEKMAKIEKFKQLLPKASSASSNQFLLQKQNPSKFG